MRRPRRAAVGRAGGEDARPGGPPRRRSGRPAPRAAATASRGAGPFSRWPVVSASTVSPYSLTASASQPTSVAIRAMTPAASSQPPKTRPRNSSEHAERAEERPPRRSGHVDAGRRPVVDDGRQRRARSARCRGRRCAAPSASQYSSVRASAIAPRTRITPPNTSPRNSRNAPDRRERRRERRAGHVDAGRRLALDPLLAAAGRRRASRAAGTSTAGQDDHDDRDEDRQERDDLAPVGRDELRRSARGGWSRSVRASVGQPSGGASRRGAGHSSVDPATRT